MKRNNRRGAQGERRHCGRFDPGRARGRILRLAMIAILVHARPITGQTSAPERIYPARYESCTGWGLCAFRLTRPDPELGEVVRVRLRGVGDPALAGTCDPEREAARAVRRFVEGILARAARIELAQVERRPSGTVLAVVRVDGTDVTDILVHIGFGRGISMPPGAKWCD